MLLPLLLVVALEVAVIFRLFEFELFEDVLLYLDETNCLIEADAFDVLIFFLLFKIKYL